MSIMTIWSSTLYIGSYYKGVVLVAKSIKCLIENVLLEDWVITE